MIINLFINILSRTRFSSSHYCQNYDLKIIFITKCWLNFYWWIILNRFILFILSSCAILCLFYLLFNQLGWRGMLRHMVVIWLFVRSFDIIDFMTLNWSRLPFKFLLEKVSSRIVSEVHEINWVTYRVIYDVTSKLILH